MQDVFWAGFADELEKIGGALRPARIQAAIAKRFKDPFRSPVIPGAPGGPASEMQFQRFSDRLNARVSAEAEKQTKLKASVGGKWGPVSLRQRSQNATDAVPAMKNLGAFQDATSETAAPFLKEIKTKWRAD